MFRILILLVISFAIVSCGSNQVGLKQSNFRIKSYKSNQSILPNAKDLSLIKQKQMAEWTSAKNNQSTFTVALLEPDVENRMRYELSQKIIAKAESFLGTPYRYGGTSKRGIDCSSFVQKAFGSTTLYLPRVSKAQARLGYRVNKKDLQKGDLVFFATAGRGRVSHVGIVHNVSAEGEIEFIHASSSQGVTITPLANSYWSRRYLFAKRVLDDVQLDANAVDFFTQNYPKQDSTACDAC